MPDTPTLWDVGQSSLNAVSVAPISATPAALFPEARVTKPRYLVGEVPFVAEYPKATHLPEKYRREQALLSQAGDIISEAIDQAYEPAYVFILFSGGYDSLATTYFSTHYVRSMHPGTPYKVVHINTGIGIPETRRFVRMTRDRYDWPYAEYTTTHSYEDIITTYGFPGPPAHRFMYTRLKERPLRALIRDHTPEGDTSKMLFITGVRREESQRRMGHVEPVKIEGRSVWVAPFTEWTKHDVLDFLQVRLTQRNQVVDTTHKSGECLCGAFAHRGELAEIELFYPETGAYLRSLEERVKSAGFPWGWEEEPPAWFLQTKQGQQMLEGFEPDQPAYLCSSCEGLQAIHQAQEQAQPSRSRPT